MIQRILLSLLLLAAGAVPAAAESPGLAEEIEAFLNVIAVAGREEPAEPDEGEAHALGESVTA